MLRYLYHRDLPKINEQEELRSPLLFYADLYSMTMYYQLLRLRKEAPWRFEVLCGGGDAWKTEFLDEIVELAYNSTGAQGSTLN